MIKALSAQCGQCLPSLVWPVSGNAERGSASFLPLSVTSRAFHWCKQDRAHLFSPESNEHGCSSRQKSGWEGCAAAHDLTFKGLLTAPTWAVRCRPEVWVQGAGQSGWVRENQKHAQAASPRPLCFTLTGFQSAPLRGRWQAPPPQVLDTEFPPWGPFFSYLATRHHLLVSLWSQPTPHFVNEAFLKDTHPTHVFQKLT